MNKVLRKRVPRELKKGFLRYLILCLLVSQGMFIVVSLVERLRPLYRVVRLG